MLPVVIECDRARVSYPIEITSGELSRLGRRLKDMNIANDIIVITHASIRRRHGGALASSLRENGFTVDVLEVPEGEASKSAGCAFELIERIAQGHASRACCILAFGGGVIGDLAGFVAALYRRGVPYVQVPTTLLAQIDSSMGGKVAVDLPFGKNLVGAFYHPRLVFIDVTLLSTLDARQVRNGLAEAVKYGVICDKNLFSMIEANRQALLGLDESAVVKMVHQCCRIKANIVSRDEQETKGLRAILNFGHTVGHAIESAGSYAEYHHGEAVALGMRVAAQISLALGWTDAASVDRLNALLTAIGLPEQIRGLTREAILDRMRHDKKFQSGKNRFVLMTGIGSVKLRDDVPAEAIAEAIDSFLSPAA